jgi:hypothetical protein
MVLASSFSCVLRRLSIDGSIAFNLNANVLD